MEPENRGYAHPEALVSPAWLAARLDQPSVRVVDARFDLVVADDGSLQPHPERAAYAAGHVPGAVFLDVMGDLSDPDDPTTIPVVGRFEALMARLGIGNDTTVVVYDGAGGTWAARLWWALRYHGHDDVAMLDGGFGNWIAEGNPTESGVVGPTTAVFKAQVRPELRVTADQVEAAIDDPGSCIVDALPEPVYTGEMRLYPTHRAGHIPGAANVPAPANLDPATMRMLPAADLARLWEPLGLTIDQRVITYCGGGVYASFDLFALYLLGHENAALYDASWSEWGADPDRPVETSQ
jgi:thiosulfate/3-mercaptopyruvate sulfurtransferase